MKEYAIFPALPSFFAQAWNRKLEATRAMLDPVCGLIQEQLKGINYHTALSSGTVHRTRENVEWLPALLAQGRPEDYAVVLDILPRLLALQDQNPESKTYGVWPYLWEEPLDKMKNPDWNWAPFIARVLLTLLREFPNELPQELRGDMRWAVFCACECICRRRMGVDYTNISLMSSFVLVCGGETLGEDRFVQEGLRILRAQLDFVEKNGAYAEYNSPYYGVIDIEETGRGLRYFRDPEARKIVRSLHEAAWQVFANHFHWATRQIAPPHARCYADIQDRRIVSLIELGMNGTTGLIDGDDLEIDLLWPFLTLACPPQWMPFFEKAETPRVVQETFYREYDPIGDEEARVLIEKGTPSMNSYAYLHPEYCLGSFDRHDLWNQRRPLMAYFRAPAGVICLRARCLHDDMDYASAVVANIQRENAVAGILDFVTDHGDYHYILTPLQDAKIQARRLVFRVGVKGALDGVAIRRVDEESWCFALPQQDVYLSLPLAVFGNQVPQAFEYKEADEIGVELVFVQGEPTVIDFAAMKQAFACYWLEVVPKGGMPATSAHFEQVGNQVEAQLVTPGGVLRTRAAAEIARFMPEVPGYSKRFRNGGFYYVQETAR